MNIILENVPLKSLKFESHLSFHFLLHLKKKDGLRWFIKIVQNSAQENAKNDVCIEIIMTPQ